MSQSGVSVRERRKESVCSVNCNSLQSCTVTIDIHELEPIAFTQNLHQKFQPLIRHSILFLHVVYSLPQQQKKTSNSFLDVILHSLSILSTLLHGFRLFMGDEGITSFEGGTCGSGPRAQGVPEVLVGFRGPMSV